MIDDFDITLFNGGFVVTTVLSTIIVGEDKLSIFYLSALLKKEKLSFARVRPSLKETFLERFKDDA